MDNRNRYVIVHQAIFLCSDAEFAAELCTGEFSSRSWIEWIEVSLPVSLCSGRVVAAIYSCIEIVALFAVSCNDCGTKCKPLDANSCVMLCCAAIAQETSKFGRCCSSGFVLLSRQELWHHVSWVMAILTHCTKTSILFPRQKQHRENKEQQTDSQNTWRTRLQLSVIQNTLPTSL